MDGNRRCGRAGMILLFMTHEINGRICTIGAQRSLGACIARSRGVVLRV
jgi:hypothetical protein